MYAVDGATLARTLKIRRDKLVTEALSYYAFLAHEVEIHATNAAEIVDVTRIDDHHVDIAIRSRAPGSLPYFHRTFDDAETSEIRLKTWGGNDRVILRGEGEPDITFRIVGGTGDDEIVDSTRSGRVAFYDDAGRNTLTSVRGSGLNSRPYSEWIGSDSSRYPPREWGTWWRPIPSFSLGSDLGLVVGAGFIRTRYGFRKSPYASNVTGRLAYATGASALSAELTADVRRENRIQYWRLRLLASGTETPRYYGLGNQSTPAGDANYHKVAQQLYAIEPSAVWSLGRQITLAAGPLARWSRTSQNSGRFIASLGDTLYGAGEFGQLGGRLAVRLDSRDKASNSRRGVLVTGEGRLFPGLWDVTSSFGSLETSAETYLSADIPLAPTLALRAGGKKLWGTFPFHESAFVGGPSSLRGYYKQRFAGDASLTSSAELRLTLAQTHGLFPALWGIFGNGDAGRVYVHGSSPGGWHTGVGGGVWVAMLDRANTATIGITTSHERTALYAGLGFAF